MYPPLIHMTSNHDKTLQLLGFTHDSIVETIMVTVNSDGTYNAAPMGVINRGGFIEARPFRSSSGKASAE